MDSLVQSLHSPHSANRDNADRGGTGNIVWLCLKNMNRPRVTRWLRITWTAFWGIAAVLLCVLWVRSYRTTTFRTDWHGHSVRLVAGSFRFDEHYDPAPFASDASLNAGDDTSPRSVYSEQRVLNARLKLPLWSLLAVTFASAAIPWISWSDRFSLRTLLIATSRCRGAGGNDVGDALVRRINRRGLGC